MIVTELKIKNVGLIVDETIPLNKPLILFYGEIRQGKTTILNAVRWVCGGAFPTDIIRHGEKEASIELLFEGGSISRSFYIAKDGKTTKARDVVFIKEGKPVASPVRALQALLNPFLLDQDYLRNMTELERKRYFAEMFKVDTTEIDAELATSEAAASALRSEIKGFGEIDITKVERVDVAEAQSKLKQIRSEFAEKRNAANKASMDATSHSLAIRESERRAKEHNNEIVRLKSLLQQAEASLASELEWQKINPEKPDVVMPIEPDTAELELQIQNAAAQNVRAEQYERNVQRAKEKAAKQSELEQRETRQRELRTAKLAKLAEVSKTTGIPDLSFDEHGEFTYQGTQAGMLSTSQLMRLSSELSSLYPEGFGIELLDRGESLGKSIFDYIERAKSEDLTILATIVGEKPAVSPPDVGVFVVEKGKIKS